MLVRPGPRAELEPDLEQLRMLAVNLFFAGSIEIHLPDARYCSSSFTSAFSALRRSFALSELITI